MTVLLRNNVDSTLATAASSSDLGMTVVNGGLFPSPTSGEYFYATVTDPAGLFEVVKVTARAGNSLTVVRAQEGTNPTAFATGSRIELRVTAQTISDAISDSELDTAAYFAAAGSGTSVGLNVGVGKTLNVDGTLDASGGVTILPQTSSPAQVAEGAVVWDTSDDLLTVGTGSGRKIMVDTNSVQTVLNKTLDGATVTGSTVNNTPIGATTASTGRFTTLTATGQVSFLPLGTIVLWYGASNDIPTGWRLCNGTGGTPDLRGMFIVGAGGSYSPNNTGGTANAIVVSHTHPATSSVTDPGHRHTITRTSLQIPSNGLSGVYPYDIGGGGTASNAGVADNQTGISVSTTISTTGDSGTNANLPPYYALCYIMRNV